MIEIKQESVGDVVIVSLSGELTLTNAAEIKQGLQKAVQSAPSIAVKVERIDAIDLSFLQLLCGVHRTAMNTQKLMTLLGVEQDQFSRAAEQAGFFRHVGCPEDGRSACFWLR